MRPTARAAAPDRRARLRRRPVLLPRRPADHLAAIRRDGLIADVWTMKPDGTDPRQLTDFGAMSWAPTPIRRADTWSSPRTSSGSRTSSCSWSTSKARRSPCASPTPTASTACRCRRPTASTLAWTSSRRGGQGGQILIARLEPRGRARGARAAPARTPSHGASASVVSRQLAALALLVRSLVRGRAPAATARSTSADAARATSSICRADELEGRLTGTERRAPAADYLAGELDALGAPPLAG